MTAYIGRSGDSIFASKNTFIRREMPYGCYHCADGREVLFDREYKPICQRYPGQPPTLADAGEWVVCDRREWFYDDGTPEHQKRERARKKLEEWGMLEPVMRQIEQLILMGKGISPFDPRARSIWEARWAAAQAG
jgi:hypothetical protein